MDLEAKSTTKQYCTCNSCHTKNTQQKKNIKNKKKRSYEEVDFSETEKNTNLEVVKVADFLDYITQLLNIYTTQTGNKKNMPPFHFKCKVNISTLNSLAKDVADFFVELIEKADKFYGCIYHQFYSGKNTTTYWYFCSQRCNLASKSKKHQDISKYCDAKQ
ncbi:hypothetical protein RclHR1_04600004 [Rhizophagus clarus]|uniref:Uncharacterized protein n=1 Tax=Rhizophagus clarus TaxID=94130 RepID=A0A2Z6RJH3_9GLOM|nr:hypothetical protein RclHR1_04600004 [Rhizophagus clarus]